jgi:hypothetical protein
MARPRKPTKYLKLVGAFKKNPKRLREREGEPEVTAPLGDPPDRLDEAEKARWRELAADMPWLGGADRVAVEMAAKQFAAIVREGGKAADYAVLRGYLSDLGGMAGSRSKLKVPGEKAKVVNPFAKLSG